METLKLKIFEVLVEKITVLEFENWLYNSEFLKEELKSNSLIFSLVDLNYRNDNIIKKLEEVTSGILCEEEKITLVIEQECRNIINVSNSKEIEKSVLRIIEDFDFDDDFQVLWNFYDIYHSFEGYYDANYFGGDFEAIDKETKALAEQTLKKIENCNNIQEKVGVLSLKNEDVKVEEKQSISFKKIVKPTFKNKILAFLKKI